MLQLCIFSLVLHKNIFANKKKKELDKSGIGMLFSLALPGDGVILGAESGLPRGGDPGLHLERHRGSVDVRPLVHQRRVPAPPPPRLRLGICSFCVLRAVCSTDPQLPNSSFTCEKRPQAGPAHRATTPLSSCLRPLLGTSYLVCSVLSIDYALIVCTGKGANHFPATTPLGK